MKPKAIRNERTVKNFSETVKGTRSMRPGMGIYKLNILGWRRLNRVTISSRSTGKSYLICIRAREESLLTHGTHRYNSTCTNSIVHVYIVSNLDSVPSLLSNAY